MSALEEVKDAILASDKSIEDVAFLSGVSKTTIYKFLKGHVSCKFETVTTLLAVVGKKVTVTNADS